MLTDRASLLREFFRLVNADSSDDDLIEHDSSTLEGAYSLLQQGLDDAQQFLIDWCGMGSLWAADSSALTFSGTFPNRYAEMPSDFLRLVSDQQNSGLRKTNGYTWGREILYSRRHQAGGDVFYLRGIPGSGNEGKVGLYLGKNASPPSGLVAEYYARLDTLADGTTVDMPQPFRGLIVAYAAQRATSQAWFPGDGEAIHLIDRHLGHEKKQARSRARLSAQPQQLTPHPMVGDHWF